MNAHQWISIRQTKGLQVSLAGLSHLLLQSLFPVGTIPDMLTAQSDSEDAALVTVIPIGPDDREPATAGRSHKIDPLTFLMAKSKLLASPAVTLFQRLNIGAFCETCPSR